MTDIANLVASPSPTARPSTRWVLVGAVLLVLIMVVSGFGAINPFALPSGQTPSTPVGGTSWVSPMALQSGAQLQSDPTGTFATTPDSSLPNATVLGPAPASQTMYFTVGFPMQNAAELAEIINEQGQPGSPLYHDWLNNAEEAAMFGPPTAEVQDTVNYFTSLGFQVSTYGAISVSFAAPVRDIDAAFHTTLSEVAYHNATSANVTIAATSSLSLPVPIIGGVSSISGLTGPGNYQYFHSQSPLLADAIAAANESGYSGAAADPASAPVVYNATVAELYNYTDKATAWFNINYAFGHQLEHLKWQTISAATTTELYQADPLLAQGYNGNSTGTPIRIVIVMEGGINPGDIEAYSQLVWNNPYQLYNRIDPTPVDGAYTWNGTEYYTDGGSGEMALDIEYSSTMAPGAEIIPVYSQYFAGNFLDDQYATIDAMPTTPNIISNSWGGSEDGGTIFGPGLGSDSVMNYYFMLLDAKGASILASSGDGGGFDTTTGILSGSFPANDPYVASINGLRSDVYSSGDQVFPTTNLTYGNLDMFIPGLIGGNDGSLGVNLDFKVSKSTGLNNESFWYVPADFSNLTLYDAPPEASGGFGISYDFQQPWWQHAVGVPDVGRSLGSAVGAEADFNESIFFDGVPNYLYGGTSFACPTTAGMIADIEDFLRNPAQNPTDPKTAAYLGNLNMPIWEVANAWQNGNLSLAPFYDITNGTSVWGNRGASANPQYSWPPGQNLPTTATGQSTYGDTMPGWDFPTGWGSINVYNFAHDLNQIDHEGAFDTVNTTTNANATSEWFNMTLNNTYTIDVTANTTVDGSNPTVIVEYFPQGGGEEFINYSSADLTYVGTPTNAMRFTLNTGAGPFAPNFSPGLLIFTLGTTGHRNMGFGYDWVGPDISPGPLTVSVVDPSSTNSIVGGCASANLDNPLGGIGGFGLIPGLSQEGLFCYDFSAWSGEGTLYSNVFEVKVTNYLGEPVYNAQVTATVPRCVDLAFTCSEAETQASYYGRSTANRYDTSTNTLVSFSFTNLTGVAFVYTENMAYSAPYQITASYGPEIGYTNYTVTPAPNVLPGGIDGGKYAEFNSIDLLSYIYREGYSNSTLNTLVPNFTNTSALYDTLYGWQGQILSLKVTNSTGAPLVENPVWLGTYDTGHEYKFIRYSASAGILGMTNSSNTSGYTNANGDVSLQIPDNASDENYLGNLELVPIGLAAVAVSIPGTQNESFDYREPCTPDNASNPNLIITCVYNNSYYRNYTATPMWILPDPVNITTMTNARVPESFFTPGQPLSFMVNVTLPTEDPLGEFYYLPNGYNGNPFYWSSGLEHITGMDVYIDGHYIENITPEEPPEMQLYDDFVNLTGNYTVGIHELEVIVTTSMGQTFSYSRRFIVGSVVNENINQATGYINVPYNLTWSLNLNATQVSNVTFNSSLEITYLGTNCPTVGCVVVNYSIKVHPEQLNYAQSINLTLLESKGFYSDAGELPTSSDYEITIWFHANHSGYLRQGVSVDLIFDPVQAEILGPLANAVVPLGNVTIAYQYQGDYVTNATLYVYQNLSPGKSELVFSQLAFQPGIGGALRSGSTTWTAVSAGIYWVSLSVGSKEGSDIAGEAVNVSNLNPATTITKTDTATGLFGLPSATAGTLLVLIGSIVGILLGLWISPALRPTTPSTASGAIAAPPKAWEEGKGEGKKASASANECPICHERFETPLGLHQHQRVVHGVEE